MSYARSQLERTDPLRVERVPRAVDEATRGGTKPRQSRAVEHSAIYEGWVRHRRFGQRSRDFRYPLFMMYLDLSELEHVFERRWLWSTRRPALARFDRRDFFGAADVPLDVAVRDEVERVSGRRPAGPIRLLTHLRYFGYSMNPVSFYYCFGPEGKQVEAILAEITNTPWRERRAHVLHGELNLGSAERPRYRFRKDFHVSPFLSMDFDYDWRFTTPHRRLLVHMENRREGALHFDATLNLERRPITGASLASVLTRHPFMTWQVVAQIYGQALRLALGRYRFFPHPNPQARIGG